MHIVNIVIEYTLGIKENTKTHKRVVDGEMQKVKDTVTTGEEFTDCLRVIKAGRLICNFFTGSPQRKKKLEDVVECNDLPSIMGTNYPDTRVAFASKFFGTLLANHYEFKLVGNEDHQSWATYLQFLHWVTTEKENI